MTTFRIFCSLEVKTQLYWEGRHEAFLQFFWINSFFKLSRMSGRTTTFIHQRAAESRHSNHIYTKLTVQAKITSIQEYFHWCWSKIIFQTTRTKFLLKQQLKKKQVFMFSAHFLLVSIREKIKIYNKKKKRQTFNVLWRLQTGCKIQKQQNQFGRFPEVKQSFL